MSVTPNYGWPLIATNQASPEITHNDAMVEIDDALGGLFSHVMTDADYTLNVASVPSEAGHLVYEFTGAITADRNIIVPSNKKLYAVWNNVTSPYNLVVKTLAGTGVTIPYSATASYTMVYSDSVDVVLIGMTGPTGPTGAAGGGMTNPMTTQGDIIYEDASLGPAALPIGTPGQVLTVVGSQPAWAAGGGGGGVPAGSNVVLMGQPTGGSPGSLTGYSMFCGLFGRGLACIPASWTFSFQVNGTVSIGAAKILKTDLGSLTVLSSTTVLFGGLSTGITLSTGRATSDAIALQLDASHDWYIVFYISGLTGTGIAQSFGSEPAAPLDFWKGGYYSGDQTGVSTIPGFFGNNVVDQVLSA
jgi:hypothetical protein